MSQIITCSLEPGMGLDKLKKDDIKKMLDQRGLNYWGIRYKLINKSN